MESNKKLAVTIGITAFNCEDTIEDAIRSALHQDHKNIKIIIADDCSTDRTVSVALKLANSNANISLIKNRENKGVSSCRNIIIKNAKTPFLAFFDDDDTSEPNRISIQLNAILSCETLYQKRMVFCHSARQVEYNMDRKIYQISLGQVAGDRGVSGKSVSEAILHGSDDLFLKGACPTCSQMARTQSYRKLGGFDENLRRSEDTELAIRAAENGATFVGISIPLVHQRMTTGIDKNIKIETENWFYIYNKHRKIIERKMSYSFAISWLKFRHSWMSRDFGQAILILTMIILHSPLQTFSKLRFALPNIKLNLEMSKFYKQNIHDKKT